MAETDRGVEPAEYLDPLDEAAVGQPPVDFDDDGAAGVVRWVHTVLVRWIDQYRTLTLATT